MLTKLLKHEFKATSRFMWVIFAATLLLSVAANVSLRLMERDRNVIVNTIAVLLMVAWVISLVVGAIAVFVMLIKRFYSNLLTDEGYLMFTLPANVHQLVLSKLIVATVWFMVEILVLILSVMIAVFDNSMIAEMLDFVRVAWREMTVKLALNGTTMILETLVLLFVSIAGSCLQFYSAMSIGYGCVNHKALKSVAAYFVMWFVLQTLGVFGINAAGELLFRPDSFLLELSSMQSFHLSMLITTGVSLAVAAVFYIITVWNLKKRLNLA